MKKLLSKLYILAFMGLTVLFTVMIWNVTFGHIVEEYHSRKVVEDILNDKEQKLMESRNAEASFQEAILDSEETVKHYLGYRILEEKRLSGHFHHIDFDIGPDTRNYCIKCHGEMPHDKVKEIRAFANMHASFVSCETCHVKLDKSVRNYKWYSRATGEITESPVSEQRSNPLDYNHRESRRPGTYESKIVPLELVDGTFQRIDTQERIDFALQYKANERTLSEVQKSKALKIIHKIVDKEPYKCENCHQKEEPLLSFVELGYPSHRVDNIVSTEVVGMINKYSDFFIPEMLHPGEKTTAQ